MDETPLSEYDTTIIRNYITSITQRVNEINMNNATSMDDDNIDVESNNKNAILDDLPSPPIVTV